MNSSPAYRNYQRRPTNKVMPVGMNYLSDLVIRPGIRKFLWPLCLYRGNMSPGHAHRLWNMSLLMMAAEAETLSDGLKIVNNPNLAQLCGPVRVPGKTTMMSFFGRLYNSPDVTCNIPGFTEYVKSLELGSCWLTPVNLETDKQFCAPWRVSTHPDFDPHAERPEPALRNLYYPYLAHDPKKADGHALVLLANELVTKELPDQVRADVCQDLVVAILSGEIEPENAHDWVQKYVREVYKMFPQKWDAHGPNGYAKSFNQPIGRSASDGGAGIQWTDRI